MKTLHKISPPIPDTIKLFVMAWQQMYPTVFPLFYHPATNKIEYQHANQRRNTVDTRTQIAWINDVFHSKEAKARALDNFTGVTIE